MHTSAQRPTWPADTTMLPLPLGSQATACTAPRWPTSWPAGASSWVQSHSRSVPSQDALASWALLLPTASPDTCVEAGVRGRVGVRVTGPAQLGRQSSSSLATAACQLAGSKHNNPLLSGHCTARATARHRTTQNQAPPHPAKPSNRTHNVIVQHFGLRLAQLGRACCSAGLPQGHRPVVARSGQQQAACRQGGARFRGCADATDASALGTGRLQRRGCYRPPLAWHVPSSLSASDTSIPPYAPDHQ